MWDRSGVVAIIGRSSLLDARRAGVLSHPKGRHAVGLLGPFVGDTEWVRRSCAQNQGSAGPASRVAFGIAGSDSDAHSLLTVHVLITGMSGTGKSAVVAELRRRGYTAYDADDHGFSEPSSHGAWGWRVEAVRDLLSRCEDDLLFFAGCSEEQALFHFDLRVLLTAPEPVIIERLQTRKSNSYGRGEGEMDRVVADLRGVEPLLRKTADLVIETTVPVRDVADRIVERTPDQRQ
jgi:hypothetical protein